MDRLRSPPDVESLGYVSWEEVKSDKGRREIFYYLKKMDGGLDLAVKGKEKSLKLISYRFVVRNTSPLFSMVPSSRPKSRSDVIDWLNSVVSDAQLVDSSHLAGSLDDSSGLNIKKFKDSQQKKLRGHTHEFSWLGSPWACRKRRKHYQSFCRNGVEISVCDFVYILAEDDKQLVAYLEDMYEDSKGSKMVLVRWFHKIDEVGIALSRKYIDREIFFSLCLQDLSIECIDGTATVLSPLHFDKFLKEARNTMLNPFVCHKLFENEEARPFDITQVKGYWKQEILRYMCLSSPRNGEANSQQLADDLIPEADINDGIRPRKRRCLSREAEIHIGSTMVDMHNVQNGLVDRKSRKKICSSNGEDSASRLSKTETQQNPSEHLKVGVEVEVLSQDSGIRGCWFRALILKRHKNKMKVRYRDIKDADEECNNLEEWVLATRIAVPDKLGIRISGRAMIRPHQDSDKGPASCAAAIDAGTSVDVWRNDVWQEGIVVQIESDDRVHVYFPGEQQDSVFGLAQLRKSREWFGNRWIQIKEMPDIVTSLSLSHKKPDIKIDATRPVQTAEKSKVGSRDHSPDSGSGNGSDSEVAFDISKDDTLTLLKWNSSKKRRRSSSGGHKSNGSRSWKEIRSSGFESLQLLANLKVDLDHENCKYMGDSLFGSAAQPLTSLVMSR